VRKLLTSENINLRQAALKVLLDIVNGVPVADSQQHIHTIFRTKADVTGCIAIRGKENRDAKKTAKALDFVFDIGTVSVDLDSRR